MTTRYRLTSPGCRGGTFYCVAKTTSREQAQQLIEARTQPECQPALNLHIAKAYLTGTDNGLKTIYIEPGSP